MKIRYFAAVGIFVSLGLPNVSLHIVTIKSLTKVTSGKQSLLWLVVPGCSPSSWEVTEAGAGHTVSAGRGECNEPLCSAGLLCISVLWNPSPGNSVAHFKGDSLTSVNRIKINPHRQAQRFIFQWFSILSGWLSVWARTPKMHKALYCL